MADPITTEHLSQWLPEHIQTWVKDQQPEEPLAMLKMADANLRNLKVQDKRSGNAGGYRKHDRPERPPYNPRRAQNGNSPQRHSHPHKPEENRSSEPEQMPPGIKPLTLYRPTKDKSKIQCQECREYGHYRSECPALALSGRTPKPTVSGFVNGDRMDSMLLDSGLEFTTVKGNRSLPSSIMSDVLQMTSFNGVTPEYPMAKVEITENG